ncbi:MAG: hypothetical protein ACYTE6_15390, partial [Planctomycetota bacterium]
MPTLLASTSQGPAESPDEAEEENVYEDAGQCGQDDLYKVADHRVAGAAFISRPQHQSWEDENLV